MRGLPTGKVVIPSFRRASVIGVHPLLPIAHVVVAEDEVDVYRTACGSARVVVSPNQGHGKAGPLNWALRNLWARNEDFIFFCDDDLLGVVRMMTHALDLITDAAYIEAIIRRTALLALDMGAGLFGYAHTPRPQERLARNVFSFRGWLSGHAMGVTSRALLFDEALKMKDDVDMSLQCLARHRIALGDRRHYFATSRWTNPGGLQTMRTAETEAADMHYLNRKWGKGRVVANTQSVRRHGRGLILRAD